jgi:hypothetical protein
MAPLRSLFSILYPRKRQGEERGGHAVDLQCPKAALSLTAKQAIGEFDRVRKIFGQSYSVGAIWLYVVLGKQVKKDTRGWIDAALLEDVHWREAFDSASKLEAAFQLPGLKTHASNYLVTIHQ